jgi:hypothetical protein
MSTQSPSFITWGWYNRPVVAAVPSGLSLTPLTIINNNNNDMNKTYCDMRTQSQNCSARRWYGCCWGMALWTHFQRNQITWHCVRRTYYREWVSYCQGLDVRGSLASKDGSWEIYAVVGCVTRQRTVKTGNLVSAIVNCGVREFAISL